MRQIGYNRKCTARSSSIEHEKNYAQIQLISEMSHLHLERSCFGIAFAKSRIETGIIPTSSVYYAIHYPSFKKILKRLLYRISYPSSTSRYPNSELDDILIFFQKLSITHTKEVKQSRIVSNNDYYY